MFCVVRLNRVRGNELCPFLSPLTTAFPIRHRTPQLRMFLQRISARG